MAADYRLTVRAGPRVEHERFDSLEAALAALIRDAVWRKELKHHVGEPGFIQPPRTMSAIGG